MLENMRSSRRRVLTLGVVTLSLSVSAVCLASSPMSVSADGARSIVVSYAALSLTTQRGAETLYRRLRYAALEVCEPLEIWDPPRIVRSACYQQALSDAVVAVDASLVTALYNNDR